jgi:hypothetical protein
MPSQVQVLEEKVLAERTIGDEVRSEVENVGVLDFGVSRSTCSWATSMA